MYTYFLKIKGLIFRVLILLPKNWLYNMIILTHTYELE